MALGGSLEKGFQVTGATDATDIGNVGDRLKVDAAATLIPQTNIIYKIVRLKNGSSAAMNVNGSVTPVNFDFVPGSGETWFVEELSLFLLDSGATVFNNFGAISALTNGCKLVITSGGVDYTIFDDMKNNTDIIRFFPAFPYVPPTSGFIEQSDAYKGALTFQYPAELDGTGDKVRFIIQDNLTNIEAFEIALKIWKER